MASDRQHDLAVFAFDLMYYDGIDLKPVPLIDRRLQLTELVARSDIHCMHPAQAFDDGVKLLEETARHGLEGIVSKRKASAYRSGPSRDWVKTKTAALASCKQGPVEGFSAEVGSSGKCKTLLPPQTRPRAAVATAAEKPQRQQSQGDGHNAEGVR